jgi:hypothetical protein
MFRLDLNFGLVMSRTGVRNQLPPTADRLLSSEIRAIVERLPTSAKKSFASLLDG